MTAPRANVASTFMSTKGAMIDETYSVFASWDLTKSKKDNLDRLRSSNEIGAASASWLEQVVKVLNRRFDPNTRDQALVFLAQHGCPREEWKPILLWHLTRDEFLFRDFLESWLYPAHQEGAFRVRPEQLHEHLRTAGKRGALTEHDWTETSIKRVAAGLLKMAADFGLLQGSNVRELTAYHLPERSFLYLLHALSERNQSASAVIHALDWRLFLMPPSDVEQELLRLHQFRKLSYHVAGSLAQLDLPCATALEYARSMVA
jgi:hypothetical protein